MNRRKKKKPTKTVGQYERINNHVTLGHFAHFQARVKTARCDEVCHTNVVDIATTTVQIEPSDLDERDSQNGYGQNGTTCRQQIALVFLVRLSENDEWI